MEQYKIIEVKESVFADNDREAARLREDLKRDRTFLLNLMSSPGSGKTTTLRGTIERLRDDLRIAAMRLTLQLDDTPNGRKLMSQLLRIEQYVDMVLMYLRLDEGTSDYVIRSCDVDEVIRQSLRKFAGEFIDRRLTLHYAPVGLTAVTDEKWLGFVVEQVLSNALKYTPEGGSITIDAEEPATLCIRDTGIGIAPEDLPRIFDRGYTGRNGRTHRQASGIGLYLCRRICRDLGHTITAASAVGEGTVIRLDLSRRTGPLE